ncbi:hypothetical protein ONE63_009535 [Megalurothrips usitatus]|uniref:Uncharacterized protein n=1 Tax=Megalurothrips usitatus TaxID=439358 RepID=A0AAV7XNA0_9NEOP|nr:hypothetical protein ONE63_011184 [Megalurothrips usitatus]KAJ1526397.1 hypothetical protein ONE63_009535 [Megalurothrips usitatus]
MSIKSQSNGILLNVTWKPASIYGLPDATLYNTKMSFEKKTMSFDVALPSLTLSGPHKVTGRILLLPITGSGPSKIVLTNATLHIAMNWPIHVGADGKEYVSVGDGEVKITRCDLLEIELQGLFNGHKVLGAEMNKILNQNWRLLHQELSPSVANRIFEEFRKVIEILLKNVPVTDLFAP